MKKAICIVLAVVALVVSGEKFASAAYVGQISASQTLTFTVDNSASVGAAAVTAMYLGKTIDTDMFTIARAETKQFTISKWPRGTTRLVVIVDPSLGASVLVSWTAGSVSSPAPVNCGGDPNNQAPCTFTFDVVP